MSDLPIKTDTPEDHAVIGLSIESDLLPDWFEAFQPVAARFMRRMSVVEKPEVWLIKVELPRDRVDAFKAALAAAWQEFEDSRDTD